jgi:hypothetical protein
MDDHTLKLVGYLLLDIAAAGFAFLGEYLATGGFLTPVQAVAVLAIIAGCWVALEEWLRYKFKIPPEEEKKENPIPKVEPPIILKVDPEGPPPL